MLLRLTLSLLLLVGLAACSDDATSPSAPAPSVTGVTPNSGGASGGTAVTISGANFVAVPTVTLGGVAATNVAFSSATSITATVPAGTAGPVEVVVTNPDGQKGSLLNGYTYIGAPTVTGVAPNTGGVAGGTPVTITGTGFEVGATVTLGGVAATSVLVTSNTTLTATTGPHAAGSVDVVVTNPGGQAGTLANGFSYVVGPTVSSVAPNSATTAGGVQVTITGANFVSVPTVTIGGVPATNVAFASASSILATVPAHAAGTVDVVVTNPDGQSGTLAGGFTYRSAPTVVAVTPNQGPTAGGTGITISGSGFVTGATVTLGGAAATGVSVASATTITATTPAHAAGSVDIVVTNPDSQAGVLSNGFTYTAGPSIASITPNRGPVAGGFQVTISGANFVAVPTVTFGGTPATNVAFSNSTSLLVTVPARGAGTVDVVVTNPDNQSGTLAGGFTYDPPPAVSSVSPNTGGLTGGDSITISGTAFVNGATVLFGSTPATGVVVNNATSITAVNPPGSAGAVDVVVTNPDGQSGTLSNGFTYLAPTLLDKPSNQDWQINLTFAGGAFQTAALLVQDGENVTGDYFYSSGGESYDISTNGKIVGNKITVTFSITQGGLSRGSFTCTGFITGSPQRIIGTDNLPEQGFTSSSGFVCGSSSCSGSFVMQ